MKAPINNGFYWRSEATDEAELVEVRRFELSGARPTWQYAFAGRNGKVFKTRKWHDGREQDGIKYLHCRPPTVTKTSILVRVPLALHKALKDEARDAHLSLNQLCVNKLGAS